MNGDIYLVEDVVAEFSDRVIEAFHNRQTVDFSIALSGGSTAEKAYEHLAAASASEIDWLKVDVYWGDERCVPLTDKDSNYRLCRQALLDRVGPTHSTHPMKCGEIEAYNQLIDKVGGIDLVHLGLGPDGHTASLFPQSKALDAPPDELVVENEDPLGNNPHPRETFTFTALSRAKLLLFTVSGDSKADALGKVSRGEDVPAAHVRADRIVWLADEAASAQVDPSLLIKPD